MVRFYYQGSGTVIVSRLHVTKKDERQEDSSNVKGAAKTFTAGVLNERQHRAQDTKNRIT